MYYLITTPYACDTRGVRLKERLKERHISTITAPVMSYGMGEIKKT